MSYYKLFILSCVLTLLFISSGSAQAQKGPVLSPADRVRLGEVIRLSRAVGEQIWPGWDDVPFAILLVTPDREFLIGHPQPSDDFTSAGVDPMVKGKVYVRPRQFSPNLLATFPAVSGLPTVVIGQPEQTGKSSTLWVITALHEHFHQIQQSQPDYYEAVKELDLSGGDESGMWMLDYPFPYDSVEIGTLFAEYQQALAAALAGARAAKDSTALPLTESVTISEQIDAFLSARGRLEAALSPADFRYLSFQIWQEGVSRYTEHRIAALARDAYVPSSAFGSLRDALPYEHAADLLKMDQDAKLANDVLSEKRRASFYAVGAAEAHLLDYLNPDWQSRYFEEKFDIAVFFGDPIRRR